MRFATLIHLTLALVGATATAADLTLIAPERSYFAPVNVEGTAPGSDLPTVRSYCLVRGTTRRLGPASWSSDLTLLPDVPAVVCVSAGGQRVERTVTWASVDCDGPALALVARLGDLIALRTAGEAIQQTAPDGEVRTLRTLPGFPRPQRLSQAGTYRFVAGGGPITVRVHALPIAPDPDHPVAVLADNHTYRFPLPEGSDGLFATSADPDLVVTRVSGGVDLRVASAGTHLGVVRIRDAAGPILGTVPVVGYAVELREALDPLPVDAQGRPGTPGTLTVLGAAGEPQRFRARIVIIPWVPNLKLTFTKFAHPAYFLGGATTFTVLSDGTRTTLDEPGFVVTTRADGTRVGTFDYTIYSPAGNRSQCVHITFRTLFPGAPAAVAWLTKRMVSP